MITSNQTILDDTRLQELADAHMGYSKNKMLETALGITTVSTKEKSIMTSDISSSKLMQRVSEAGLANQSTITQGFVSNIPWEEWNKNYTITHDAKKTDLQGKLIKMVKDDATFVSQTQDYKFGAIFRNAFDPAVTLADGSPLISINHALKNGGTTLNTFPDTQQSLNYTSLNVAQSILTNRMKNHSGERTPRLGTKRLTLLVPNEPAIVETAFQLVMGNTLQLKPGTNNNDANFYVKYEGVKYDLIISDVLNLSVAQDMGETAAQYSGTAGRYETNWFLLDQNMVKLAFKKIVLDGSEMIVKTTERENLCTTYNIFSFFGYGATSIAPFAIFGSKGDNTATNF